MTTNSCRNGKIALSRMNVSGYVYMYRTRNNFVLFSSRVTVRVRIRFNVRLVTGYARVFVLLSV